VISNKYATCGHGRSSSSVLRGWRRRTRNADAMAGFEWALFKMTLFKMFGGAEHRQQHAEGGLPRQRLAFDDAAMIADDLGDQCEAKTAAGRFGGDEGIEQVRKQIFRHARTIVLDAELQRQ